MSFVTVTTNINCTIIGGNILSYSASVIITSISEFRQVTMIILVIVRNYIDEMAFGNLIFIVGFSENPKNIEIFLKRKAQNDDENSGLSVHADCKLTYMLTL